MTMDPKPLENFAIMMCVTHPNPCDLGVLRELVGELTQMATQKTAGQRSGKDLSWDNLERVRMGILCEAVSLVNSGQLEEMEAALRAQQEMENQEPKVVNVETNFYDKEETYENCTVQVLTNTVTGEVSVGWYKNEVE